MMLRRVTGSSVKRMHLAGFSTLTSTTPVKAPAKAVFNATDVLNIRSQLSEEEIAIWDTAKQFCEEQLMPGILDANRHEKFDKNIMKKMGEMGLLGPTLEGYGCAGLGYVA